MISDNGNEFTGFEFQEIYSSYGVTAVPITVKNPLGNSVVERMHLIAAAILRTMTFTGDNWINELDKVLPIVAWNIFSTFSTVSGYSSGQLASNKNMIMQSVVIINRKNIKQLKHASTQESNKRKNKTRLHHQYNVATKC